MHSPPRTVEFSPSVLQRRRVEGCMWHHSQLSAPGWRQDLVEVSNKGANLDSSSWVPPLWAWGPLLGSEGCRAQALSRCTPYYCLGICSLIPAWAPSQVSWDGSLYSFKGSVRSRPPASQSFGVLVNLVTHYLMTGTCSEKCALRQFCHDANITEFVYINLGCLAHGTPRPCRWPLAPGPRAWTARHCRVNRGQEKTMQSGKHEMWRGEGEVPLLHSKLF